MPCFFPSKTEESGSDRGEWEELQRQTTQPQLGYYLVRADRHSTDSLRKHFNSSLCQCFPKSFCLLSLSHPIIGSELRLKVFPSISKPATTQHDTYLELWSPMKRSQNITNVLDKHVASERPISVEYAGVNKYASRQFLITG